MYDDIENTGSSNSWHAKCGFLTTDIILNSAEYLKAFGQDIIS